MASGLPVLWGVVVVEVGLLLVLVVEGVVLVLGVVLVVEGEVGEVAVVSGVHGRGRGVEEAARGVVK